MPNLQVKTTSSEMVWQSPDGSRKIFKLVLDYNGQQVQAKTYSNDIAKVGWSGEVMTYEKTGRSGAAETFVRQPAKEGGYQGGSPAGKPSYSKPQADPFTMYLSYAKDLVVAHIAAQTKDGVKLSLDESIAETARYGRELYDSRPDAPEKPQTDVKSELDEVFGETEVLSQEEPWTEPPQLKV